MWRDLVKFRHFGRILTVFEGEVCTWQNVVQTLAKIFLLKGKFCFFVNGQILRKELIISGHTAAQLDPHFRINSDLQIMLNYGCSRSLVRSSLFIFTFSLNYSDEKTFLWRKLRDEVGDQLSTALWRLIAIISSVPIGYSIFYSQSERSKPA